MVTNPEELFKAFQKSFLKVDVKYITAL